MFLDDLDKFANEDDQHRNAEEYVAVQAGIDEIRDCGVLVLATANELEKLPNSLIRTGRFDRKIQVLPPNDRDAGAIIRYYLRDKNISEDVDLEDIEKMTSYSSCARLETIVNEAAINAAFARRGRITMSDLTKVVLRMEYTAPDSFTVTSEEEARKVALHEAGHLVVCEVLCPGSVGLASLRARGRDSVGGFIRRCKKLPRRPYHILVYLAGKAAVELSYSETCASGCQEDIEQAYIEISTAISESGTCGLGMIDVSTNHFPKPSEDMIARNEAVVYAELERYMFKVRDILLKNRKFLDKAAALLLEKETLLYSDIKALRESVDIINVPI